MVKKSLIFLLVVFNLLAVYYLLLPVPSVPDLTNAVKSDLPGDTTQLVNVNGYFTNQSRTEVINFYKANFNGLFRIQLNHPPEHAKDIFRDTMQSYYLEEFVLPFKESLFVNGYEWANDVFTKPDARVKNKLIFDNKEYKAKINTKIYIASLPVRLADFFLTEAGLIAIFFLYRHLLTTKNV